ncbi:MAG: hypothetical protein ACYTF9_09140 [Planctomycetota bacterium]|jgi:mono/diheme cytochrome c family protein
MHPTRLLASALLISGCATTADLAPPVDQAMLDFAASHALDATVLETGRLLYVTACVRCHSPEAVTRYSLAEWASILPRMADEAALSPAQEAAVMNYVRAAAGAGS